MVGRLRFYKPNATLSAAAAFEGIAVDAEAEHVISGGKGDRARLSGPPDFCAHFVPKRILDPPVTDGAANV
jgi:hypothetical protein